MIKRQEEKTTWFFVDESGDLSFYGKGGKVLLDEEGCSRVFILGFVEIDSPEPIRERLAALRDEVAHDPYLQEIDSLTKTARAFHAKDDCPEVRMLVFRTLAEMDFSAQVIVARKVERMFRTKYERNEGRFYDDLVTRLFENVLHRTKRSVITFSRRGTRLRQRELRVALEEAVRRFSAKWQHAVATDIEVLTARPSEEPVLQVVDYVNWAVQRAFHRGEMRYFDFLRDKYSLVLDVFDVANYAGGKNYYTREKNPFDISKVSPFG